MASGRTHAKATLVGTPIVAGVVFLLQENPVLAGYATAGCLSGIFINPDLDQQSTSFIEWKLIRATLGLGYIWLAFWGPYAIIIKHRSPLSHAPFLGTAIRFFYIWGGLSLVAALINSWTFTSLAWLIQQPEFWAAMVGLCFSDILHWIFDIV